MLIGAFSEMKEEAWEFIRFFDNEESQKTRALEAALLPTRKALYHDREVAESLPMIAEAKEALLNVRPRPVSARYSEMSRAMLLSWKARPRSRGRGLARWLGSKTSVPTSP